MARILTLKMRLSNMPSRISQSQIGDESHTRLSSEGDEATRRSYSRPLKQVSWISTKKLESLADIQVAQVTSKELKNLHTCVPYHLEGPGLVVNDIQDDVPKCQDNPSELPTPTKAPSDDLLFRAPAGTREEATEALRTPVGVDTELTMDMLKVTHGPKIHTINHSRFRFAVRTKEYSQSGQWLSFELLACRPK